MAMRVHRYSSSEVDGERSVVGERRGSRPGSRTQGRRAQSPLHALSDAGKAASGKDGAEKLYEGRRRSTREITFELNGKDANSTTKDANAPIGFVKLLRSGPQAMRVPFEAFAGEPDPTRDVTK